MNRLIHFVFFIVIAAFIQTSAQTTKVQQYLKLVAQGRIDEVKVQLPDLLAAYPDDPGVLLLHGVVIEDGYRALDIYKEILRDYPDSEWADDAYWRIIQFYAVTGDTTRARVELENFRKKYSTSEFLTPAADVVRTAVTYARRDSRQNSPKIEAKHETNNPISEKDIYTPPHIPEAASKHEEKKPEMKKNEQYVATEHNIKKEPETQKIKHDEPEEESEGTYGLQVGIFSTREAAQSEMKRFLSQRMRTEIREKKVDEEMMFAVVVGDYSSKASAEAAKTIVQQQCKCNPIVFKK